MEDKNKEIQLTDEEIEKVSGGVARTTGYKTVTLDNGQASTPKKGTAEGIMKEACDLK